LTGSGGLQGVLDAVPPPARLLRIAGEEHVELAVPEGIALETVIAYRSVPMPLDPVAELLGRGGVLVLLHSAAAARHFAEECDRLGLARGRVALAALGPRIAAGAGEGWQAIHVAATPDDTALLEMARNVCDNA